MRFGPFFYDKRKAGQDKMFILITLMHYCTSKSCEIQVIKVAIKWNFNCQREKASRIGDHIGRNFEPWDGNEVSTIWWLQFI